MLLSCPNNASRTDEPTPRRLYFYEKGESVPMGRKGFWEVYRGVLQLSKFSSNGDEMILAWLKSSKLLEDELEVDNYQVKGLSPLYLRWYSQEEVGNDSTLAYQVLQGTLHRMAQTQSLISIAAIKGVEERLIQLLKLLQKELGEPIPGGTRISTRFTHHNLATAIRTTRVTVTRLLGELQRQHIITLDGDRCIIVLNS